MIVPLDRKKYKYSYNMPHLSHNLNTRCFGKLVPLGNQLWVCFYCFTHLRDISINKKQKSFTIHLQTMVYMLPSKITITNPIGDLPWIMLSQNPSSFSHRRKYFDLNVLILIEYRCYCCSRSKPSHNVLTPNCRFMWMLWYCSVYAY